MTEDKRSFTPRLVRPAPRFEVGSTLWVEEADGIQVRYEVVENTADGWTLRRWYPTVQEIPSS